jgi:hypothetical protein
MWLRRMYHYVVSSFLGPVLVVGTVLAFTLHAF